MSEHNEKLTLAYTRDNGNSKEDGVFMLTAKICDKRPKFIRSILCKVYAFSAGTRTTTATTTITSKRAKKKTEAMAFVCGARCGMYGTMNYAIRMNIENATERAIVKRQHIDVIGIKSVENIKILRCVTKCITIKNEPRMGSAKCFF